MLLLALIVSAAPFLDLFRARCGCGEHSKRGALRTVDRGREREFFIDNQLVRSHSNIEMVWRTGRATWELYSICSLGVYA